MPVESESWQLVIIDNNSSLNDWLNVNSGGKYIKNAYSYYGGYRTNSITGNVSNPDQYERAPGTIDTTWDDFAEHIFTFDQPPFNSTNRTNLFDVAPYSNNTMGKPWPCWVQLSVIYYDIVEHPNTNHGYTPHSKRINRYFTNPGWYCLPGNTLSNRINNNSIHDIYTAKGGYTFFDEDGTFLDNWEQDNTIRGNINTNSVYWVYMEENSVKDPRQWFSNNNKLYNDYYPGKVPGVTHTALYKNTSDEYINKLQIISNNETNSFEIKDTTTNTLYLRIWNSATFQNEDGGYPNKNIFMITPDAGNISGYTNVNSVTRLEFELCQDSSYKHLYSVKATYETDQVDGYFEYNYPENSPRYLNFNTDYLRILPNRTYFLLDSIVFPGEFYLNRGESMFKYAWKRMHEDETDGETIREITPRDDILINIDGITVHTNSIVIDKVYRDNHFVAGYNNGECIKPLYIQYVEDYRGDQYKYDYQLTTKHEIDGVFNSEAIFTYEAHSPNSWQYTLLMCVGDTKYGFNVYDSYLYMPTSFPIFYSYWGDIDSSNQQIIGSILKVVTFGSVSYSKLIEENKLVIIKSATSETHNSTYHRPTHDDTDSGYP